MAKNNTHESGETTSEEATRKSLEDKYVEFQVLEQQVKQLQTNVQTMDSQIMEIKSMQLSVAELNTVPENSKALFPIANGMFVRGTVADPRKILVNVGGNVVIDKTVNETIELLETQLTDMTKVRQQLLSDLEKTSSKMQNLETERQKIMSASG